MGQEVGERRIVRRGTGNEIRRRGRREEERRRQSNETEDRKERRVVCWCHERKVCLPRSDKLVQTFVT
jgi:hypothetical protein